MTKHRTPARRMYLWVWERCFYDYTAGLGVAVAPSAEAARKLIRKQLGYDHTDLGKEPRRLSLNKSVAFAVHGGG